MKEKVSGRSRPKNKKGINFDDLHTESHLEQLLLASDSKHLTVPEEENDLFDFYITPYTEKEVSEVKHRQDKYHEDTMILKFGKKDEGSTQLFQKSEEEQEVERLKKIIDKKNTVIGELTQEIRVLNQEGNSCSRTKRGKSSCIMRKETVKDSRRK